MTQTQRDIIAALGVDLTTEDMLGESVVLYRVDGGEPAVRLWHNLRSRSAELGAWPVLCGGSDELEYLQQASEHRGRSVEQILASIPEGPPLEAMAEQFRLERELMLERMDKMNPSLAAQMRAVQAQIGTMARDEDDASTEAVGWPTSAQEGRLPASVFDVISGEPHECLLALVPTLDPTEVPAYLRFGGFNSCPPPEIHVAMLREWGQRFATLPICVTHDVIELFVLSPPQTKAATIAVAREQYKYSPDIVDQGTGTVGKLAMELWQSPYWYFWWD